MSVQDYNLTRQRFFNGEISLDEWTAYNNDLINAPAPDLVTFANLDSLTAIASESLIVSLTGLSSVLETSFITSLTGLSSTVFGSFTTSLTGLSSAIFGSFVTSLTSLSSSLARSLTTSLTGLSSSVRFNTTSKLPEYYDGSAWNSFGYVFFDQREKWQRNVVTDINYHNITQLRWYRTSTTITAPSDNSTTYAFTDALTENFPSDTIGLILSVYYAHNGGADHGYWSFKAYQYAQNAILGYGVSENYHYNDYFNSDYHQIIIPWNMKGEPFLGIQTTQSYNSNQVNKYSLQLRGLIRGTSFFN